ncbi:MAG: adaptor protein MecA [Blautia sp.]|nr:adaptor protein MecA [Blautia sp.]
MKLEKLNDNQIRCTLTKQDLADRQINIREFVYGSEKAKGLFQDMIQQANYEFGFEANDLPLMVEAIPLSSESLILVITKVEYPEELDTRFSQFSEPGEDMLFETSAGSAEAKGADDILGLFNKIREEQERLHEGEEQQAQGAVSQKEAQPVGVMTDLTKMFEFSAMESIERLSHVLTGYYDGENDLYKNEKKNRLFLMVHKSGHTPEEFNKVCNMISEYGQQRNYTAAVGAYYAEHCARILRGNALQVIAAI